MNKKGIIGSIIIAIILILLVGGGIFYYQLKKHGVQIKSGNVVIDLTYNETPQITGDNIRIIEEESTNDSLDQDNMTNFTSLIPEINWTGFENLSE